MTVVTVQATTTKLLTVPCVICAATIPSEVATTGSLYANGAQAFACMVHMRDRARWVLSWLRFEAAEQPHGPSWQSGEQLP